MGKTLIAEAGIYEAMKTGKKAYYTTPLIALTGERRSVGFNKTKRVLPPRLDRSARNLL